MFEGGLSGVAFGPEVALVSRVTQGCAPVSKSRVVTAADRNLVLELNGEPALDVLLDDLAVSLERPEEAIDAVRSTLVGLVSAEAVKQRHTGQGAVRSTGNFGDDVTVRHIIGLDPTRRGIAHCRPSGGGRRVGFLPAQRAGCTRRFDAHWRRGSAKSWSPQEISLEMAHALQDSELEAAPHPARRIAGAVYVSCSGRGGPHFGGDSAELQIVRRALGDVPLGGFFCRWRDCTRPSVRLHRRIDCFYHLAA